MAICDGQDSKFISLKHSMEFGIRCLLSEIISDLEGSAEPLGKIDCSSPEGESQVWKLRTSD